MKNIVKIEKFGTVSPIRAVNLNCPNCNKQGNFVSFDEIKDLTVSTNNSSLVLGQRRCPNTQCLTHIFFVMKNGTILDSYPPQKINFDTSEIPIRIVKSFEEAITCHAHKCFIAAAIMIRKTLEELCQDCGATGKNLKNRVLNLKDKIILPQELFQGIDDLRLLGNDAAHLESQEFSKIEEEEIEISIEFTKEILKAKYQYKNLLKRLQTLKKTKSNV